MRGRSGLSAHRTQSQNAQVTVAAQPSPTSLAAMRGLTMPDVDVDRTSPANPGNIPSRIRFAYQRGWDSEPATPQQLRKLRRMFADNDASGKDVATLFGDQFRSLDLISKFAAWWALDQLSFLADEQRRKEVAQVRARELEDELAGLVPYRAPDVDPLEAPTKSFIARHYRQRAGK